MYEQKLPCKVPCRVVFYNYNEYFYQKVNLI